MTEKPTINEGQPLTIMLDGKETLLFPDKNGNTYITFSDGTAAVHVAPGDRWVYVEVSDDDSTLPEVGAA
jgi:hypothetical protein